jgi:RNA polymerase sigma factor (sigma-70 family)
MVRMMTETSDSEPEQLLRLARAGSGPALGQLLELYRNYLTLLAGLQISRRLQSKVDAADLIQETFLQAHKHFSGFRGTSEGELMAWLRQILSTTLANLVRHYYARQRRDVRLEQDLAAELEDSSRIISKTWYKLVGFRCSPLPGRSVARSSRRPRESPRSPPPRQLHARVISGDGPLAIG